MIYFESSCARVDWDETLQCAILSWKTYAEGEAFKDAMNKGLELVAQKKAKLWIADLRSMKVAKLVDQDWINADWLPRIIALGVKRSAMVLPTDILAQMTLQRVRGNIERQIAVPPIENVMFDDIDKAKEWLRSL